MNTQLIDLQAFGSVYYLRILNNYSHNVFNLSDRYRKRTFRNRYFIAGANGVIDLTIPLQFGRDQKQQYQFVKIDYNQNWQQRHLRSIVSSYNKSPWFEYYATDIEQLIMQRYDYLYECNLAFLDWTIKVLKAPVNYTIHKEGILLEAGEYINNENNMLPSNYAGYTDGTPIQYQQVFEDKTGFLPNLSILDLIFCTGPAARSYLGH